MTKLFCIGVIQARYNSTRFPGKAMMLIAGKPMLEHVIDRTQKMKVEHVVVATGMDPSNDCIEQLAIQKGCKVHRGSEEDVLQRYYDVSNTYNCENIVRVTGDNPFTDVALANKLIHIQYKENYDYLGLSNVPLGVGVEIFRKSALDKAFHTSKKAVDREHVSTYIKTNTHLFSVMYYDAKIPDSDRIRLTVDYKSDYLLACEIYDALYDGSIFSIQDVLTYLKKCNNTNIIPTSLEVAKKAWENLRKFYKEIKNKKS